MSLNDNKYTVEVLSPSRVSVIAVGIQGPTGAQGPEGPPNPDAVTRTEFEGHTSAAGNPHNVTKAQIGLGSVDNTSDAEKPISNAVAGALAGKAAAVHAHAVGDVTGLQTILDGKASSIHTHTKSQIIDFAHSHIIADVTGLQTALDAKAASVHTHTRAQITDFAHSHLLADVSGLQSALDGKASSIHTHTKSQITDFAHTHIIAEVTGLQNALDAKATPADIATAISNLVNGAGAALDTLSELSAALGNDPNFATTVSNSIGTKLAKLSNLADLTNVAAARTNLGLAAVAASGSYNDLSNKPTAATFLPSYAGNSGKFLTTDGSNLSWGRIVEQTYTNGVPYFTVRRADLTSQFIDFFPNFSRSDWAIRGKGDGWFGGLLSEAGGQTISIAINTPQIGARNNAATGGIFRLDTRAGYDQFVIFGYSSGGVSANQWFNVDFNTGAAGLNTNTPRRRLDVLDATAPQFRATHTDNSVFSEIQTNSAGNTLFTNTGSFFSFNKYLFIANTSAPTSNPVGGGYLYVENGAYKYRGSNGTVTVLGNA